MPLHSCTVEAKPASMSVLGRRQYIRVINAAPVQMSMDGTTSEVGSRPPSESGDHPSKEAHKKGRFKVCPLHRAHSLTVLCSSLQLAVPSHAHREQSIWICMSWGSCVAQVRPR